MHRSGFTLVENVVVLMLISVLSALAVPRIKNAIDQTHVRRGREAITTVASRARAVGVQRGCPAVLHMTPGTNGQVWLTVCAVGRPGLDTLGGFDPLAARFGLLLEPSRDSLQYDPRGLRIERATAKIRLSRGQARDSVVINELGKVVQL
jgi:prepilin-type N-terminal cleavage/methylation domain-containing protein